MERRTGVRKTEATTSFLASSEVADVSVVPADGDVGGGAELSEAEVGSGFRAAEEAAAKKVARIVDMPPPPPSLHLRPRRPPSPSRPLYRRPLALRYESRTTAEVRLVCFAISLPNSSPAQAHRRLERVETLLQEVNTKVEALMIDKELAATDLARRTQERDEARQSETQLRAVLDDYQITSGSLAGAWPPSVEAGLTIGSHSSASAYDCRRDGRRCQSRWLR
jgi:hypothetical protein